MLYSNIQNLGIVSYIRVNGPEIYIYVFFILPLYSIKHTLYIHKPLFWSKL